MSTPADNDASQVPVSFGAPTQVQPQHSTLNSPIESNDTAVAASHAPDLMSQTTGASHAAAADPHQPQRPNAPETSSSVPPSTSRINQPQSSSAPGNIQSPFLIDSGSDSEDNSNNGATDEYFEMAVPTTESHDDRPSNERLLGTAFVSFMSFALVQSVFAVIAGSKAMMGDSAAMIVDALTYLFNWIAERRKRRFDDSRATDAVYQQHENQQDAARIWARSKRKMVLKLEIFPPVLSVSTLLVVTVVVTRKSIHTLLLDMHRDPAEQLIPNVNMMLAFSVLNLGLDMLNVFCFAKAKHLMGYAVTETADAAAAANVAVAGQEQHGGNNDSDGAVNAEEGLSNGASKSRQRSGSYSQVDVDCSESSDDHGGNDNGAITNNGHTNGHHADNNGADGLHRQYDDDDSEHANLNMCSAYTHVFADTLRSIAVIVAAVVDKLVDGVTPEEADAAAAVVVSVLIVLSLVPLCKGLVSSLSELRAINREEEAEQIFQDANQQG